MPTWTKKHTISVSIGTVIVLIGWMLGYVQSQYAEKALANTRVVEVKQAADAKVADLQLKLAVSNTTADALKAELYELKKQFDLGATDRAVLHVETGLLRTEDAFVKVKIAELQTAFLERISALDKSNTEQHGEIKTMLAKMGRLGDTQAANK